jgi:hypothetical protein
VALLAALPVLAQEVVTEANLDVDWFLNDTRAGGTAEFDLGPATPPLGAGSFHMDTTDTQGGSGQAKAQMFTDQFGAYLANGDPNTARNTQGVLLADITEIGYWSYRDGASTNPMTQVVSLNMEVDQIGDGTGYTTLVYEPYYSASSQGPIQVDVWQEWDAYDAGNGLWWSTRAIPGVCAFNCFVPWSTIVQNNPNAQIIRFFGFNVGSGWVGEHWGATDHLTLTVTGEGTSEFDFEALAQVQIDVRPGTEENHINANSRGQIPVAIFGSADFDATTVDPFTVVMRGAEASTSKYQYWDVNGDGYDDILVFFRAREIFPKPILAECEDPDATIELTGATTGGVPFAGSDHVAWKGPDCKE